MVGEHLAHPGPDDTRGTRPLVESAEHAAAPRTRLGLVGRCDVEVAPSWRWPIVDAHRCISQKLGPTGSEKSPRAVNVPSASSRNGNAGSGLAAGPLMGRAPSRTSNSD